MKDGSHNLFLNKVHDYTIKSKAAGGIMDDGPAYQKNLSEDATKLQMLFRGGDLTKFAGVLSSQSPSCDERRKNHKNVNLQHVTNMLYLIKDNGLSHEKIISYQLLCAEPQWHLLTLPGVHTLVLFPLLLNKL